MTTAQNSLLLVTVDCLRSDHCGFNGYSRSTTPFLDALANESFVVPTAVIAGSPTYYSFPAIFASRMPLALGRDIVGLAPGEHTLAETLQQAGYATAAFSAANPYLSAHFGYDQGFETFQDFLDFDVSSIQAADTQQSSEVLSTGGKFNQLLKRAACAVGLGRLYDDLYFQYCVRIAAPPANSMDALRRFPSAEAIVGRATSWLSSVAPRPFFLWLHLMDPHSPYYPSPAAFRDLTGRDASPSRARYVNEFWNRTDLASRLERKKYSIVELYDAGIRSMDNQVARLVTHLKKSNLWNNCTFALTADHGEEFLDHGRRYHAPVGLHEEIVRVPLLIRVPASVKREVPQTPFSHLHLAPTLLEILGVSPPESFRGTSLWRNLQQGTPWDVPALTECAYGCTNPFRAQGRMVPRLLSVRDTRHKLVMRVESGATEEIYDLQADPKEDRPPQSGAQKEVRKELLRAARRHICKTVQSLDSEARLKARLRDLRVELQSIFRDSLFHKQL